ncbi:MAG: hypothetical protein ACK4VI_02025 [Alphaproteobacteria bacterium]
MKLHMLIIVAVMAVSLIFITSGMRQANSMSILVSAELEQFQKIDIQQEKTRGA